MVTIRSIIHSPKEVIFMNKKLLPLAITVIIASVFIGYIISQTIAAKSYEEIFTESVATVCSGFSHSESFTDGFSISTYSRSDPSVSVVINAYKKTKDANEAYESRYVYGIGGLPEGGSTQNLAHGTKVYLIHDRKNAAYLCCGQVGSKIVFGIRSGDGNYFSVLYTSIRDTYFDYCIKAGM